MTGKMARWFQDEHRLKLWQEVEWVVAWAWGKLNVIPEMVGEQIRRCEIREERMRELEHETQHDVAAFVSMLAEQMNEAGRRWVHFGLTSSDVVDTAAALAWKSALDELIIHMAVLAGQHSVRCVERLERARKSIATGTISGPVGTYSSIKPEVEALVLGQLRLGAEPAPSQIVARDRHAEAMCALAGTVALLGERDETVWLSQWATVALQNVVVWGERDISHSSTERVMWEHAWGVVDRMVARLHEERLTTA